MRRSVMAGTVSIRRGHREDAEAIGRIAHDAFADIAAQHNFPKDFPSVEVATGLLSMLLAHPGFYAVVAERDDRILGSNFLDERGPVVGVGPITVDPPEQNAGVGRRLMQGPPINVQIPGCTVRPATTADLASCNALCLRVHGHHRSGELQDALRQGTAQVVERDGRVTGYTTGIGFFAHAVGETTVDIEALIGAASTFTGPGFHVPNTNHELLCWSYAHGLHMVKAMTLMTIGLYNEPDGAYLPSVLY